MVSEIVLLTSQQAHIAKKSRKPHLSQRGRSGHTATIELSLRNAIIKHCGR